MSLRAGVLVGLEEAHGLPRRVWSATLVSALARQWSTLCTLLALPILQRALDPGEFGRFTFYLAAFALLDVLVDCGTSSVAVQHGAGDGARFAAAIAGGRRIRAGAALVGATLLGLGAGLAGERGSAWVLLAALAPLTRAAEMSAVVFQRDIRWGRPLALRAAGATLRLGAIALLARRTGLGFGPFLALHAWSLALVNVALHYAARARLPRASAPLAGMLARAAPLAVMALVQQAYFWADNGFVRALAGLEELGRYNVAVRLFQWLAFFLAFATGSALPWLSRRALAGSLGPAAGTLALPLFLAASATAGALTPWAGEILARLGPELVRAADSLRWLLFTLPVVAWSATLLTSVIAAGRTRAALAIAALALGVNLVANALLVPGHGSEGAALATLLTEGSVALAALAVLHRLGARLEHPTRFLAGPALLGATWLASRALHAALGSA